MTKKVVELTHAVHHTYASYALCGVILRRGERTTPMPICPKCQRLLTELEREDEVTERQLKAESFARALQITCDRYLSGYMSRPTWSEHMQSLWGQVEHDGLRAEVVALVDPLAQQPARTLFR